MPVPEHKLHMARKGPYRSMNHAIGLSSGFPVINAHWKRLTASFASQCVGLFRCDPAYASQWVAVLADAWFAGQFIRSLLRPDVEVSNPGALSMMLERRALSDDRARRSAVPDDIAAAGVRANR
jgi:hypothetical protein